MQARPTPWPTRVELLRSLSKTAQGGNGSQRKGLGMMGYLEPYWQQ